VEGDFKTVHLLLDETSFEKLIQLFDDVYPVCIQAGLSQK